jgi:predicted PurR-regulated permease PerM
MQGSSTSLYARLTAPLLFFTLVLLLVYFVQEVLKPLCFAGLFAVLLTAPCNLFEKAGFSRGIAALISLILALVFFIVVFYFISTSVISFQEDLPVLISRITQALHELEKWATRKFDVSSEKMHEIIDSITNSILPSTSYIVTTVTRVSTIFFISIMVMIYTFLMLLYRSLIVRFIVSLFKEQYSKRIYGVFTKTRYVIKGYIGALFIEMLIIATVNSVGFLILGVRYALLLGIISAIFNIIPYLGIFMACVLTAFITFTTNSLSTVTGAIIMLIIVHMIDSNILMPKIVGSRIKLNALATIIGVVTGTALWGIPGTFLAVPIMAILKVIFEDIESFKPFALFMGDDAKAHSSSKRVVRKIADTFTAGKEKK